MKEIPILFSTAMVQALLEGRKTQTRRIVKWPKVPEWHHPDYDPCTMVKPNGGVWWPHFRRFGFNGKRPIDETGAVKCPYGQPGDLLWVRETWRGVEQDFGAPRIEYKATEKINLSGKWKPSIHMPKEAARIWLQVTDVRVERLQDISEQDAISEGIEPVPSFNSGEGVYPGQKYKNYLPTGYTEVTAKDSFQSLWETINGADSWQANPWVWVVSFKVLSTTGKPDLNNQ